MPAALREFALKILLSFELLLCVLALYKGYQRVESTGHQALQDILVRDSVMYFLACVFLRRQLLAAHLFAGSNASIYSTCSAGSKTL
jgi:hypothetical protein